MIKVFSLFFFFGILGLRGFDSNGRGLLRLVLKHKHVFEYVVKIRICCFGDGVLWLTLLVMRDLTRRRSIMYFYSFVACEGGLGVGGIV